MTSSTDKQKTLSPAKIAQEAFRQLALRQIAPTPDAYRKLYDEIAGTPLKTNAEAVLLAFSDHLAKAPQGLAELGPQLKRAAAAEDWEEYGRQLLQITDKYAAQQAAVTAVTAVTAMAPAVSPPSKPARTVEPEPQADFLRDLLSRVLNLAVASLLQNEPELARESEELAQAVKTSYTDKALEDVASRLKKLCFRIELNAVSLSEQQAQLLKLFTLLLDNIGELLEDDSWLGGQIDTVQHLLSGSINQAALENATRSLKEVIYKQGLLKHSLAEAKLTVKNMMMTFIDRLSSIASSTGDYHQKMSTYSQKISQTTDIMKLNVILRDVMEDTRNAQLEALRSRDEMVAARQQVQEAESRIKKLETELQEMSDLVREDQLTGSLNRRGLDDVFEREIARSDRRKNALCIALLDLDDFKRLNDTYGHLAGDEALIHLVRVIKDTLRTMDVIGRFGGEEFMILLPDTTLEAAMQTVTRVQRELTKRIFMYKNEKLLITFSAGVALRREGESQAALIKRTDDALYKAKRAGKNRVVAADGDA